MSPCQPGPSRALGRPISRWIHGLPCCSPAPSPPCSTPRGDRLRTSAFCCAGDRSSSLLPSPSKTWCCCGCRRQTVVPTVLYAPTWRGPYADSQLYSLPHGTMIVQALLRRGVRVIFRAHPFNYRFPDASAMIRSVGDLLDRDQRATGRDHLWGAAAKPFGIVAVGRTPAELPLEMPAAGGGYLVAEDLTGLDEALDRLLGEDPRRAKRIELRDYYLGGFAAGEGAEDYGDGFLMAARDIIRGELITDAG